MTQAFNLSQFANSVNSSGKADLTTAVTGLLPVANGGTNASSLTSNAVLLGGTTVNTVSGLGSADQVLTSNGAGTAPSWKSPYIGGQNIELFTANGTWTPPAGVTKCIVYAIGGGGGGKTTTASTANAYGGNGGYICAYLTGLPSSAITITIGAGAANWTSGAAKNGGDTLFGTYITAGGGLGFNGTAATGYVGSVTTTSSGTVTVTTIRSIAGSANTRTAASYLEYPPVIPIFGGWARNFISNSLDYRTAWVNTSSVGAGSGGGYTTTTFAQVVASVGYGTAGALAIQY